MSIFTHTKIHIMIMSNVSGVCLPHWVWWAEGTAAGAAAVNGSVIKQTRAQACANLGMEACLCEEDHDTVWGYA